MSTEEGQCHVDFIPNSLQLSFSTTMIFEHHVVINWLILSNACHSKGSQKHIDDLCKTLQARLAILLLLMWLNLVTSTKLSTYLGEGSSHHVVQHFFLMISFWIIFFFSVSLNLAKNTKLPMYPGEGSSHHVVQHFFFFFMIFFLMCFFFFFAKRRAQCVIVGITTYWTRDGLKGDMGIQPLCHASNWWHRVRLISPYWYAFKGNGKTSCTLAAL